MKTNYKAAAELLGWKWSPAHNGYISENHRNRPGEDRNGWGSYDVAADAEEACFWEGIENDMAARRYVRERQEA